MSDTRSGLRAGPSRRRVVLVAFAIWTALGLLYFAYQYLDVFARGRTEPFHEKLIEELTAAWGTLPIAAVIFWATPRLARRGWRTVASHLGLACVLSLFHTTWNWATRTLAYAALGLGPYDYGIMSVRYLMELPSDLIWYTVFVTLTLLFNHYRASRDREVRLVELENEMTKVRLQALEARLHPHFLFNALNTVSAVMYEDVEQADRILTRLGDLLRRSLRHDPGSEVPLEEELETLELYLEVIRARFGDRLQVSVEADPATRRVRVPPFVLQPLVENAIRHGIETAIDGGKIEVDVRRSAAGLELTVADTGVGLNASAPEGIGLSNVRARLASLYGANARLLLYANTPRGVIAKLVVP